MQDEIQQMLGERLKAAIKESAFSQAEIASKIGISENALTNYVKGRRVPDAITLYKIAQTLDISIAALLSEHGEVVEEARGNYSVDARPGREHFRVAIKTVEEELKGRFLPVDEKVELITLVAEDLAAPPPGEEDIGSYIRGIVKGLVRDKLSRLNTQ